MGAGRFTLPFIIELDKRFAKSKLFCVDNSIPMINQAIKHINNIASVEFKYHDVTFTLPYPNNYFDASISFYVYHCIKNWRRALRNVMGVLASPKLLIFLREYSQWGYHLDNRFNDIEIQDKNYYKFWKEYFKLREMISPLPKVEISASNIKVLIQHLKGNGFNHIHKMLKTKWERNINYSEAIESIGLGLFTKLRIGLNVKDRHTLKDKMANWLGEKGIDLYSYNGSIPASIELDIFFKGD